MMMYEDSGLEPEADYDDEYTVATSSSGNSVPVSFAFVIYFRFLGVLSQVSDKFFH